jgi:hypothetical protein
MLRQINPLAESYKGMYEMQLNEIYTYEEINKMHDI